MTNRTTTTKPAETAEATPPAAPAAPPVDYATRAELSAALETLGNLFAERLDAGLRSVLEDARKLVEEMLSRVRSSSSGPAHVPGIGLSVVYYERGKDDRDLTAHAATITKLYDDGTTDLFVLFADGEPARVKRVAFIERESEWASGWSWQE